MSHKNELSLDFKMHKGSKICAARDGIVTAIKKDSDAGGLKDEYLSQGNHIIIQHSDGSTAMYWHLQKDGETEEVLNGYFESVARETSFSCESPDYGFTIHKIVIRNGTGEETNQFSPGEDLGIDVFYEAKNRIEKPFLALGVLGLNGTCFTSNMLLDGHRPDCLEGVGKISCTFKSIPLLPQSYTVKLIIRASSVKDMIIPYQEVGSFNVVGDLAEYGYKGEYLSYSANSTPVVVPYEWCLPDGRTIPVALSRTLTRTSS